MIRGDSWFGIVEKVAAKALLKQIELDLKHGTRFKHDANKKFLKTGKIRREESKKIPFGSNNKQNQNLKCNSKAASVLLTKTQESLKSLEKGSAPEKRMTWAQGNCVVSKLTKCLSSLGISENPKISLVKNETTETDKKTAKLLPQKNGKAFDAKELSQKMENNRHEHLRELSPNFLCNLDNDSKKNQRKLKKLAAESTKSKGKPNDKPFKMDEKKEIDRKAEPKLKSKQTLLHDFKPVSIIPPCPNISELGNLLNFKIDTKKVKRKVATKAKSSIDLPFQDFEEPKKPLALKEAPSKEKVQNKAEVKLAVPQAEPPPGRRSPARELPKKWRAGTHIETTPSGIRKLPVHLQRFTAPRVRTSPTVLPNLDVVCNKLCSSSSLVRLMLHLEDTIKSERYCPLERSRCEPMVNRYKEELNKILIYPETSLQNCKTPLSKSRTSSANKKIKVSDCADVRGFKELLAGTREYNWKTKSAVQHRPMESPWLNVLLPKEEGEVPANKNQPKKTFTIPEVDPMNEIVEACVEKELKRCAGFANVKKAKCKDFTKEKVLLCYKKSAIEKYSPKIDTEQISDLLVKHALPFLLDSGKNLSITLSAMELNHTSKTKALKYLPPPATPCTPMSEKLIKVSKKLKKKKGNKKSKSKHNKNKKKHDTRNRKMFRKKKFMEELQKQIECTPPYIFDRDKSLNDLNFEQEPETYISLSESRVESVNRNESDTEFYIADYVVDRNDPNPTYSFRMTREDPKKINEVLSAVGKAQDILLKMPSDLLNCGTQLNKFSMDNAVDQHLKMSLGEVEGNEIDMNDQTAEMHFGETNNDVEEGEIPEEKITLKLENHNAVMAVDDEDNSTPVETNPDVNNVPDIVEEQIICRTNFDLKNSKENLMYTEEDTAKSPRDPDTIAFNEAFAENVSKIDTSFTVDENKLMGHPNNFIQICSENEINPDFIHNNPSKNICKESETFGFNNNKFISPLKNTNCTTDEINSVLSFNFSWSKRFFVAPKSGKIIGFTRKENVPQNFYEFPLQMPEIYYPITKEASKSFSNIDFRSYITPDFDICRKGKIISIQNIFKSASIKTIHRGRPMQTNLDFLLQEGCW